MKPRQRDRFALIIPSGEVEVEPLTHCVTTCLHFLDALENTPKTLGIPNVTEKIPLLYTFL